MARHGLAQALAGIPEAQRARLLVRINAEASPWHFDDLIVAGQLVRQGLAGVMVPKAESAAHAGARGQHTGQQGLPGPADRIGGRAGCRHLAGPCAAGGAPRVRASGLPDRCRHGLHGRRARAAASAHCHRAGVAPRPGGSAVDGVTTATVDIDRMLADAWRARRGGFGGKLCIHPAQVGPVRTVFEPSQQDIDWAQRVLAGAEANNGGVFSLDGRMVDAPVIRSARRILSMPV